jgi:NADH-quinone oxidoreductase subunit L
MQVTGAYILALTFLPIIGGIIAYGVRKEWCLQVNAIFVFVSLLGAFGLIGLVHDESFIASRQWVDHYTLQINVDRLAALLITLVYFIAFLVLVFSVHYMRGEGGVRRYGLKLGFFISSMVGLLIADSFILLFLFWELVGFSSFLLIGYWYYDKDKAQSAKQSFMINRVADAFLLVGIILLMIKGDQSMSEIKEPLDFSTGFFLVFGAFGKSAQLPFSGWLPKAMAGPTPVSALIHAATMVTAGVYLLIRLSPFIPEPLKFIIAIIGAGTAFYAAFSALAQYDIKSVLAYSTISQLGYMMIGIGVGATSSAAFHLWTHAFFKAGLFMSAGSVIIYMHHVFGHQYDPQDMRNMGGLKRFLPATFIVHTICSLSLAGLPFFSGFMSKGGILAGSVHWAQGYGDMGFIWAYFVPVLAFLTALLTPIYIGRQLFLVYWNKTNLPIWISGFNQSLWVKLPIFLLAIFSVWIFFGLNPLDSNGWYLEDYVLAGVEGITVPFKVTVISEIAAALLVIIGLLIAYYIYGRGVVFSIDQKRNFFIQFAHQGWFLSTSYQAISTSYLAICQSLAKIDERIIDHSIDLFAITMVMLSRSMGWIDRFIVDGIVGFSAKFASTMGTVLSRLQSRGIQSQILYLLILLTGIISWILFL